MAPFHQVQNVFIFFILHLVIINTTLGNSEEQLFNALNDINLNKIIRLLDNGANPNIEYPFWNGWQFITPLMAAIRIFKSSSQHDKEKILTMIDILLIARANPNIQQFGDGKTPLMTAVQNNHLEIVEALLKAGADPNLPNAINGKTPLIVAAQNGHFNIVSELLKQKKIKINAQDAKNRTALMAAVQNNHLYIVKILLKIGKADPNIQNKKNGKTPLMIAAQNNHPEIVKALLEAEADPDIRDKKGKTALMFATKNKVINMRVFFTLKNATEKSCTQALS